MRQINLRATDKEGVALHSESTSSSEVIQWSRVPITVRLILTFTYKEVISYDKSNGVSVRHIELFQ